MDRMARRPRAPNPLWACHSHHLSGHVWRWKEVWGASKNASSIGKVWSRSGALANLVALGAPKEPCRCCHLGLIQASMSQFIVWIEVPRGNEEKEKKEREIQDLGEGEGLYLLLKILQGQMTEFWNYGELKCPRPETNYIRRFLASLYVVYCLPLYLT